MGIADTGKRIKAGVPKEARDDVHSFFIARSQRLFRSGGASEQTRWAGFGSEPKYRSFKEKVSGNLRPLYWGKSGRIVESMTRRNDRQHIFRTARGVVKFGTRTPHATALFEGGTGPFGERYPGRNFLHISPRTLKQFGELMMSTLNGNPPNPSAWRSPR